MFALIGELGPVCDAWLASTLANALGKVCASFSLLVRGNIDLTA
ncbi:hypothetical protein [Paraburkholderia sp. RAU2J]|nr:hypothetical protein [Paraburkholderia sp. RAU2J]